MTVNVVRATATLAVVGSIISLWPSLMQPGNLFALHPSLMSIAYLGLMSEGVILAALFRHVDAGMDRVAAIRQHAMVQLASLASLLLGLLAIWKNKNNHHKHHFTSLHGKVGLLTVGCSCLSVLLGALSFRALGMMSRLPLRTQAQVKGLHRKVMHPMVVVVVIVVVVVVVCMLVCMLVNSMPTCTPALQRVSNARLQHPPPTKLIDGGVYMVPGALYNAACPPSPSCDAGCTVPCMAGMCVCPGSLYVGVAYTNRQGQAPYPLLWECTKALVMIMIVVVVVWCV